MATGGQGRKAARRWRRDRGRITLSTFVTLYAVPALYLLLAPYTKPIGAIAAKLAALESNRGKGHGPQPAE